ncbi:DUF3298 domain-containing protein [Desulfovibrio sp. SGI.169]|uniref:DUF3298 and DUF4163 domain-containing protein n=1 Tax=Desulfovibrio sp. SGI.169 TaxID=3420561 RepID=UPI003D07F21B
MPRVFCCLLAALFFWLSPATARPLPDAFDALEGALADAALPPADRPGGMAASPADKEAATAEISGSRQSGVIDHLLQRPLPDAPAKREDKAEISINYPSVGNNDIDADIRQWVTGIANAFEEHLDISAFGLPDIRDNARPAFELLGAYSVSRPSGAAVSITFELWNYTGGAGNLDIMTLNYSLLTGQRLGLVDMFEAPETALNLMSAWSRQRLTRRFGGGYLTQTLKDGTAPLVENFSSLTLTPDGIRINFQPYQVAPGTAGAQKVDMPLEELLQARPLLVLWNR